MTTEWNKAETKDSVLTENTAQAVFKYLIDQESNRASMQTRWIWELLQNARDASIEGTNRLIAEVKYSHGELTFSHSGSGFTEKQIAHLIFHGSTKVEEEKTIGQYGSGFLTTHLLSSKINISGQLDDGQWFDFQLARKPDTVGALRESMDEAWENFKPSPYVQTPMPEPFTTQFVYPIINNDAANAVEKGIDTLKQCAPFVVVFNQEFSGIDIKISDETTRFEVIERRDSDASGIQQITVVESTNENHLEMQYLLAQGDEALVAIPLKSIEDSLACQPVEKAPRLFLGFPLVGTEDFSFPAVINSLSFTPTENRDGIYLAQSDNEANRNNQAIIEEACKLLIDLLRFTASSTWHNAHLLAEVPTVQNKGWLNTEWLRTRIKENLIEKIRETPVVLTENNKTVIPKMASLPLAESAPGVETLWKLMNDWQEYRETLPRQSEAVGWCQTIQSWAEIYKNKPIALFSEVMDGKKLASSIEEKTRKDDKYGKLTDLQDLLQERVSAVEWLNEFHYFLNESGLREAVRESYIVADQAGSLDKLSALYRDQDIHEELKKIAELLDWRDSQNNWTLRQLLRNKHLTSLAEEVGAGNKDNEEVLGELIEKLREYDENDPDNNFKQASAQLFAWMVGKKNYSRLGGFPVFAADGKSVLVLPNPGQDTNPPLAPIPAWSEGLKEFGDLFPENRILANDFFKEEYPSEVWEQLDEQGFIRWNMIIQHDKTDLKLLSPEVYGDDKDHETAETIAGATDFVERVAIMDRVRNTRKRAYLFWRFLTEWLIKADSQYLEVRKAKCNSCEDDIFHEYHMAAWLEPVRNNLWIHNDKDKQRFNPNARELARLLRDNKWKLNSLKENPDAAKLLEAIGVTPSDLGLEFVADDQEKRDKVINLATTLYDKPQLAHHIQDNENLPENLEKILEATGGDLSRVVEDVEKRQEQQHRMAQNQNLGRKVEEWVGNILDELDEGFNVTPVHTGADFEVSDKNVDPETSDLTPLAVTQGTRKWWIEVKSTRIENATMSPPQTKEALDKQEKFLLCVVPIGSENINIDSIRENMRFIKNIPKILGSKEIPLREFIEGQEELQADISDDTSSGVELVVEEGKAAIRVQKSVWEDEGFPLEELAENLK